ncbi:peptidase M50B-like protein [Paraburkholderia sp. BL6665CI2N2]|uniref:M50 family metallopeptidase n=1 Tax=Paraburkholderia sp. BL6665CI2N2 TaxID=1938806 RepID=UPI001065E8B4|nr:M50 family metallopeptidase [Paraburkholderia sp. BL6665CI2N2]TDY25977.1 peptidase M50B-like protein [Paraburkholderia sp. BL6665CI2N2]
MSQPIRISEVAYQCFHEAGHAVATYLFGGSVAYMELLHDNKQRSAVTRAIRPPESKQLIALAGFAAEYLLFKAGLLVAQNGTTLTEAAFIDQSMKNARDDRISYFGNDYSLSDGTWPKHLDERFMRVAMYRVAPQLELKLSQLDELAKTLETQGKVEQDQIERILEIAVDVRQRGYAIAKRDAAPSKLVTGNIRTCIAFYGKDDKNGVTFLSHFDRPCSVFGLSELIKDLKRSGCDLRQCKLYTVSGVWPYTQIILFLIAGVIAADPNFCPNLAHWWRYIVIGTLRKVCKSPGVEVWLAYPGRTRVKGVRR